MVNVEEAVRETPTLVAAHPTHAVCDYCGQVMDEQCDDCGANRLVDYPDGTTIPAERWKPEGWKAGEPYDGRCHDCNIAAGNYHHPGCDMEVCPKCGGQLISCGCLDGPDDDDDDDGR